MTPHRISFPRRRPWTHSHLLHFVALGALLASACDRPTTPTAPSARALADVTEAEPGTRPADYVAPAIIAMSQATANTSVAAASITSRRPSALIRRRVVISLASALT